MKYSEHQEYLVAAIIHLGMYQHLWARSAEQMSLETALDENQLSSVFEGFPGLFRLSRSLSDEGERRYSLQMRYAQRTTPYGKGSPTSKEIPPLSMEQLQPLLDYVATMAESERNRSSAINQNWVAVGSAVIAAIAAVVTAAMSGLA